MRNFEEQRPTQRATYVIVVCRKGKNQNAQQNKVIPPHTNKCYIEIVARISRRLWNDQNIITLSKSCVKMTSSHGCKNEDMVISCTPKKFHKKNKRNVQHLLELSKTV